MTDTAWNLSIVLIGGFATLAIFSFLIRENPFYRFFEHLYIGIAAGAGIIFPIKNFLWPKIVEPMLGLNVEYFPDGTVSQPYQPLYLLYLFPALFGLLFYTAYSRRFSWMSKLVIGFLLGASGGLAFEGFFNLVLPQLQGSSKPLVVYGEGGALDWVMMGNNLLFLLTLLAVMFYFFFSFKFESKAIKAFAGSGRWLMMVCFGAYFGSTVMARMSLLVERLQFLITDWWTALVSALT